jgi:hypothetical protein
MAEISKPILPTNLNGLTDKTPSAPRKGRLYHRKTTLANLAAWRFNFGSELPCRIQPPGSGAEKGTAN